MAIVDRTEIREPGPIHVLTADSTGRADEAAAAARPITGPPRGRLRDSCFDARKPSP